MKKSNGCILLMASICWLSACQSPGSLFKRFSADPSCPMARLALGQTIDYEQQMDAKIAAEKGSYQANLDLADQQLERVVPISEENNIAEISQRYATQWMRQGGDIFPSDLGTFAEEALEDTLKRRQEDAQARLEYQRQAFDALSRLEVKRAALKKAKEELEKLQRDLTPREELKFGYDYVKKVKDEYEKQKKVDEEKKKKKS